MTTCYKATGGCRFLKTRLGKRPTSKPGAASTTSSWAIASHLSARFVRVLGHSLSFSFPHQQRIGRHDWRAAKKFRFARSLISALLYIFSSCPPETHDFSNTHIFMHCLEISSSGSMRVCDRSLVQTRCTMESGNTDSLTAVNGLIPAREWSIRRGKSVPALLRPLPRAVRLTPLPY